MLETIIILALSIIPFSFFKIRKAKERLEILTSQTESITAYALMPHDVATEKLPHVWKEVSVAVIYESFLYQKIHAKTFTCTKCGVVNRIILDNFALAKSKNLDLYEGFYFNGIKCQDFGCQL